MHANCVLVLILLALCLTKLKTDGCFSPTYLRQLRCFKGFGCLSCNPFNEACCTEVDVRKLFNGSFDALGVCIRV